MHHISNILLKGLATLLPVALTLYLIYWLVISTETGIRSVIVAVVSESYYLPGVGLGFGLVLLYLIGLVADLWLFQQVFRLGERLLVRIPLVKFVYRSLRDFTNYFSVDQRQENLHRVVMISITELRLIGFQTADQAAAMEMLSLSEGMVAVYLPLSYQVGGYTVYVPSSWVEPIDIPFEDAFRLALTAGLNNSESTGAPPG
ncbi:DUF502 domain-containing protein [Sedimenticola hydrogenitrophicus]|uniref:DUF502 domain-containing protein n=1 Tax=Sedimenticola hydrogenitrophicus TaxID=2967975 RepID=UPI0023B04C37|nr:DUF502 domain-containing protein [Sedimenticola hydrogenitrophicus]